MSLLTAVRSGAPPAAGGNAIIADVPPASERFQVESRDSTLSLGRKARAFVANLLAGALLENSLNWPPIDVVLLDVATGGVVKRWHEHGDGAALLMTTLEEDLDGMTVADFTEKWDILRVEGL